MKQSPEAEKHRKMYQQLNKGTATPKENDARTIQSPSAETSQEISQEALPKDVPDASPDPEETMPENTRTEPIRLQLQEL